ncbi:MAG: nucleoside triphosphate pyrophosphohydrolase, partial [Pedobacter sp.]
MPINVIPPATNSPETAFLRLLTVLDTLRTQCPWDKKQTM